MALFQETDSEEVIRADNLTKTYNNGVTALKGVSLSIAKGEMVGVLGTSGSGKTTFFRLLNGSISPTGGELTVLGKALQKLPYQSLRKLRSNISVVYQHHNVIPGLSVARNVLLGKLGQMSSVQAFRMAFYLRDKELAEISRILEGLGLSEKIFDRVIDLSGGQQQRVAIARALVNDPQIILADEPIASVDHLTAQTILDLFKRLNRENKVTIVMNLHQKDFALNYCSRVIVLDKGTLIYDGHPEQWLTPKEGLADDC